jgi:hypothetical protein
VVRIQYSNAKINCRKDLKFSQQWDISCISLFKVNRRFGGKYRHHEEHDEQETSAETWQSTLNVEAICSSETLARFQRTTLRCIPEDSVFQIFKLKKGRIIEKYT